MADVKLRNPRWLTLKVLMSVLNQGHALDRALQAACPVSMDARDQSFCRALAYGVCRWYFALRPIVAAYLKKPLKPKDRDIGIILLIGLYQITIMKTNHHAAVNETVKLTGWQDKDWARGLVNAVLRNSIRDGIARDDEFDEKSYPAWMCTRLVKDWPQQWHSILKAGNQPAPMSLRVDTRQLSRAACQRSLAQESIAVSICDVVDTALLLEKPCRVDSLPGFSEGLLSVQDGAAQLAVPLLGCRAGMRVLDACAAPGGKTIQILQSTGALQLIALERDPARLHLIAENLARTGLSAQLICGDAANPSPWFDGQLFDRILADVPCSASGVMRRHPDIKLLRRADDITVLVKQQRRILSALWGLLKPGGVLVYSTCSVFKDENEHQIDWFAQKYDNGKVFWPNAVQWGEQRLWGRQILPGSHHMDGFYYACLKKVAMTG